MTVDIIMPTIKSNKENHDNNDEWNDNDIAI